MSPYFEDKTKQAIQIKNESISIIEDRQSMKKYYEQQIQKVGNLDYYQRMLELQDKIISSANARIRMAQSYLDEKRVVKIKFPWLG